MKPINSRKVDFTKPLYIYDTNGILQKDYVVHCYGPSSSDVRDYVLSIKHYKFGTYLCFADMYNGGLSFNGQNTFKGQHLFVGNEKPKIYINILKSKGSGKFSVISYLDKESAYKDVETFKKENVWLEYIKTIEDEI